MPLHIEISGDCSPQEWRAVAALTAVMLGETSRAALAAVPQSDDREAVPLVSAYPGLVVVPTPPLAEMIADAGNAPTETVPVAPPVGAMVPTPAIVAAGTANPAGVALDKSGLPWDIRIHASTKATTKDGKWKTKRGVDDNLVRHVEAELRQNLAAPVIVADAVAGSTQGVPPPPIGRADVMDPAAAFGSAAPAAPVAAPPSAPVEAAASPMAEFARIMRLVTERQAAGTLNTEMATTIAKNLGLADLRGLATRPDLIPAFEALLP